MIARLVAASLRRRFRQLAVIFAAVGVAAATVATLAGFSALAGERLGTDLAAFGPNLTVRPQVGGPPVVPAAALARVRAVPGVRSASGVPELEPAQAGPSREPQAAEPLAFSRIEVRAEPRRIAQVARRIEEEIEGVEARPLLRISESDARVTRRLQLVLAAVSAVSFLLALLSVGAATAALVGERRIELGLMMALGYSGRRIGLLLAVELLVAALAAALAGALLGDLAAGGLTTRLMGAAGDGGLGLTLGGLAWSGLAAAAVAVLVVGSSLLVAVNRLAHLNAAAVLRGE